MIALLTGKLFGIPRMILAGAACLAVILAIWWLWGAITANPKAEARLARNQAEAASLTATDAVNTVGAAGEREAEAAQITRENAANIRAAEGAEARLAEPVRNAGLTALCRRKVYENTPKCQRP